MEKLFKEAQISVTSLFRRQQIVAMCTCSTIIIFSKQQLSDVYLLLNFRKKKFSRAESRHNTPG